MRTLDYLLIVDLRRMWGQSLAICAVLACGVATFILSASTIQSLEVTYQNYYRDYRFADGFASLKRAPNPLGQRLREIPGVDHVTLRVVHDVILDIPGMIEPATCRLVSLSPSANEELNAVHLLRGRMPDSDRRGEVLASEMFAAAHGLRPGDTVKVIMGGREEHLSIAGIGMSPEYIYAVQPGQLLPDNRHFGVLWMPYRQMAAAFNMEGAFNDVALSISPRASAAEVLARIDKILAPYGGRGSYTRSDQISHRRVADEIHQLRGMALVSPTVFLAVAAFLFNLVFSRIVYHQQEQIATLRAFGYLPREIGLHYLKMLLTLVASGTLLGVVAGSYLSRLMVDLYGRFFRFPNLQYEIAWDQLPLVVALSLGVGLLGGYAAIQRAMRLPPAVAMRPEAPKNYRKSLLERLGLKRFLSIFLIMVFRRLERNPRSTLLSILGMALGVAILVLGSFMEDTINYVMDIQFQRAQRQDVTLVFNESLSVSASHDARHLPGVQEVEGFRAVPARLSKANRSRRVSIMGLSQQPTLFRVLDQEARQVTIAPGGLTISRKLSELLDVTLGDSVEVEFLEGRMLRRSVSVVAVFPDYTDPGAYMNRQDLHRILGEGECFSGMFLSVDSRQIEELHRTLKETPTVAGVTLKKSALRSFQETIEENLRPMRLTNALFASIIAFGVIYSCALIILAERSRDLATMRVLGFTRREVSRVLLGELVVITLAALPIGLPLGYGLSYLATLALDTETHRFPLVVSRVTFAYATLLILTASGISAVFVNQRVYRLDMIAVLKVKE